MNRIRISAPLTLHVDSDPCATCDFHSIQEAWDCLFNNYDLCGHPVTIQLAVGTPANIKFYDGLLASGRLVGQGGSFPPLVVNPGRPPYLIGKYAPVKLRGDPANMLGAFIYPAADSGKPGISLSDGASLYLEGVTIETGRAKSDGIDVFTGAFLSFRNIRFGTAGPWSNHFSVADAYVLQDGGYTISGNAFYHVNLGGNATWLVNNNGDPSIAYTVSLLGSLSFGHAFVAVDKGIMYPLFTQYIGPLVHGLTAWVIRNGVIETGTGGNPNHFPGTVAPLVQSGGQYL